MQQNRTQSSHRPLLLFLNRLPVFLAFIIICTASRCVTSQSASSTSHSAFWDTSVGLCERPWVKVYEHGATGDRRHGNILDLQVAVTRGDAIRVVIHHMASGDQVLVAFSVEADNAVRFGDHVCIEALSSLNHYNILFSAHANGDSLWHVLPCTTGHMHVLGVTLGSRRVLSDDHFKVRAAWFVRSWAPGVNLFSRSRATDCCAFGAAVSCSAAGEDSCGDDGGSGSWAFSALWPVYSHFMLGESTGRKNISVLLAAVSRGQDVRAVMRDRGYSFPMHTVRWSVMSPHVWVSGQSVMHVGQQHLPTHVGMRTDAPYIWLSSWSTTGKRHNSRWALDGHVSRGANQDSVSLDWMTDACWRHVYTHDKLGERISGSREELVASIRNGHRVRVVIGNTAMEADVIRVRGDHVGAQLLTQLSPVSDGKDDHHLLHEHIRWRWQLVHTTGTVVLYEVHFSNLTVMDENVTNASISWFVDTRPWRQILHTQNGATSGHVTDVASALLDGASLRLRFLHDVENGDIFAPATNLKMNALTGSEEPVTSAQVIRYLGDEVSGNHEVRFQGRLTWWMTTVDTTGMMFLSAWGVERDTKYFDITLKPEIKWFVNY